MGIGFGRGIAGCIATAVVISVTLGLDSAVLIRRWTVPGLDGGWRQRAGRGAVIDGG